MSQNLNRNSQAEMVNNAQLRLAAGYQASLHSRQQRPQLPYGPSLRGACKQRRQPAQTARRRTGLRAGPRAKGTKHGASYDSSEDEASVQFSEDAAPNSTAPTAPSRADTNAAADSNWRSREGLDLACCLRCLPGSSMPPLAAHAASTAAAAKEAIEQRLDACYQYHSCCAGCSSFEQSGLQRKPASMAQYVSLQCAVVVQIPIWHCPKCSTTFTANPVAAGCWPNTPVLPSILWDQQLLHFSSHLRQEGGVSFDGEWLCFCKPADCTYSCTQHNT